MSKTLTASDHSALIRLASSMAVGSEERKAILAGLRGASTKTAMNYHGDLDRARAEVNNRYIKELARVIAKKIGGEHQSERGRELITHGTENKWIELKWPFPAAKELDVEWFSEKGSTKVSVDPGFVDRQANQIIRDWGV